MAKNAEATLLLRIKQVGKKILDKFVITLGDVIQVAKIATQSIKALGEQFFKLAEDASKAEEVQNAFRQLAQSQGEDADMMLAKMRELSKGTISDLELMKQANNALLLGLPVDRFGDMLEIARTSAKATGQTMEFMLQSIVTGLGRGSKLILDNLGIVIDTNKAYEDYAATLGRTAASLSDAEKKTGFINAALAAGKKNADAMGSSSLSLTDMMAQLKAAFDNTAIALGTKLIPLAKQFIGVAFNAVKAVGKLLGAGVSEKDKLKEQLTDLVVALNKFETANSRAAAIGKKATVTFTNEMIANTKKRIAAVEKEMRALAEKGDADKVLGIARKEAIDREKEAQALADADRVALDELTKLRLKDNQNQFSEDIKAAKTEFDFEMLALQIDADTAMLLQQAKTANQIALINKKADIASRKLTNAKIEFDKAKDKEKLANQKSTLSTISTLANSNSKALAAIGKAAALTQLAIETPVAIGKALSAFPPPFNFIAAAAVGAAMAAQTARVVGVQLAEGGVVQASKGGTLATIGEGGQDEAVIPLDDAGGIGGNITINVFGGLLGDESSAREFAIAVDEQLLNLRRTNESVSLDVDFV